MLLLWMILFSMVSPRILVFGLTSVDVTRVAFLALGITDEADLMEVKGNKKKRGKKIDDPDFMVSPK